MSQPNEEVREFDKYYSSMQDLLLSEGWSYLIKDFTASAANLNIVETVKDEEELFFRKGQLNILANLLNLENQLEALRYQQEENEKEDVSH